MRRHLAILTLALLALALLTPPAAAFRDDFDGTSLDTSVWDVRSAGKLSYSVNNGILRIDCGSALIVSYLWIYTKETHSTPVVIETRFRAKTGASSTKSIYLHQGLLTGSSPAYAYSTRSGVYLHAYNNDNLSIIRYVSGSKYEAGLAAYSPDVWNTYRIAITATDIKVYDAGGGLLGSAANSYSSGKLAIGWPDDGDQAGWAEIDYISINPPGHSPTANFSATPTSGKDPLTVQFTDASTDDPTSWLWNFGDGYTSTAQNPQHIYLDPGQYSVHLTAQNDYGYDEIAKPYYITVTTSQVPPTADFSASPTSGTAPLTVSFTDGSTGATSWSWEFGDGWGSSARNPEHAYIAPGTYTVTLTAHNSVGSDVETKTAYITIGDAPQPADAILNGYAYDNTNNVLLDGVTITIENETYSTTNTTHGGGFYQFTGLTSGTYTVKGEKAGYLPSPGYAVQLYSGAVVQRDISLGVSGVAIVGTVYDAVTGETKNGANVTATQGTASYTSTGAGQYALNGLSKGVETTITATLAGYTHTSVTLTPTSSTPYTVDLYLIPDSIAHNGTALAGLVTDAATHNAIPNAQVSLPGHPNATTSPTGFYLFDDLAPSSYYVSASASGYDDSAAHAVTLTEGNLTWQDIELTPSSTPSSGLGVQYPPHNVKFTVLTLFGAPIPGVNVSAQGFEQTPSSNLIERLLGIDMTSTPINSELMSGTTDTNGEINFMMIEVVKYRIQLYKPGVVNQTLEIYPKEDTYPIIISTAGGLLLPDAGDALRDIRINVTTSTEGDTGHIHIDYNDTTRKTTGLTIQVTQQNTTDSSAPEEVIASHTVANDANVTHTFDLSVYKGQSFFVRLEAEHPDFGTVHRDYAVAFKGVRVPLGPLPDGLYIYVAGFALMLLGGIFGATSATRGVVVIALAGWLFWGFGWLDDLGLIAPVSLGLVSTLAVMGVIVTRYREEGYQ